MKFLKSLGILFFAVLIITSCEKEYSEEGGGSSVAVGTLKSDVTGECLPSRVNGIFQAGTVITSDNYMDVTLDFTTTGTYIIKSDTVNGYFFRGVGMVNTTGQASVRLTGVGTPLAAGTNTFTVNYGTSSCTILVDVLGTGAGVAVFTPGGSPGTCATATLAGTYTAGTALTASNKVTIGVNVTTAGSYNITVPAVNGISFTGAGVMTTTGIQDITLVASGIPTAAGSFNSIISGSAGSSCSFNVTTTGGTGTAAVYTLGGAPGNCTGVVLTGTYQAGVAAGAGNTAKFNVTVSTAGTYSIATTAVNGVTFSGSGSFTATGAQTVTLTATGTPTAAGVFNYPATGSASTCVFSVTYAGAGSAAVYTLVGAGSTCSPGTVVGTYTAGTALTATNTVTIQATVTTAGSYSLTTTAINGMTFSATGVFAGTGLQTIVLVGTGTPVAAGTNTFSIGTTSCNFNVIVGGSTATDFITCKIDGGAFVTFNFNTDAEVENSQGFPTFVFFGDQLATAADPYIEFGLAKATGTITAATYTVNQLTSGIFLGAYYWDAAGTQFGIETDSTGATQTPGFTLVISSITATRVTGTFSGTMKQILPAGTATKVISEGSFSLPLP